MTTPTTETITEATLELVAAAVELLRNAEFADGQAVILTHDAEALEAAIAKVKQS